MNHVCHRTCGYRDDDQAPLTARRLDIKVGVSYETDVNVALGVIEEILNANPRVLHDPAPRFGVTRLADSSVTISVTPWVNVPDYKAAIRELNKTILETLGARNIVIPLPQREIRILENRAATPA